MIELTDKKIMHQYFTEMLMQPLASKVEQVAAPPRATPVEQKLAPQSVESAVIEADTESQSQPVAVAEAAIEFADLEEVDEDKSGLDKPSAYAWENDRPPWAQHAFDCLLFDVCGFNFAVPLITLGQIQMISEELTPVFGQAPWFMGIQATPMGKLRIVNTAQYVMPERYQPQQDYRPTYMISLANSAWALAVDRVHQPIHLHPDAVKWRANRTQLSWLAGVVKQQMCVLIDVPALAIQLMQQDRNQKTKSQTIQ